MTDQSVTILGVADGRCKGDPGRCAVAGQGRRGRGTPEERADVIAAAALSEFAEKGFAAARIDDIARRAGISKGTVYLYFDSKELLFEEVIRRYIVPRIERATGAGEGKSLTAEATLRIIIRQFYREIVGSDLRYIMRLLIAEGGRFPHLLRFYHAEVISRGMKAVTETLRRGVDSGEFRSSAIVEFPHVIAAPAVLAMLWKLLFDDFQPLDLERLAEAHTDIILNGLRSRREDVQPGAGA